MPSNVVTAILSAVGVLVVLGIIYLIWSKWWSTPDHRETSEETQEALQLEDQDVSHADRVGLFNRTRAQPGTTKAFYAAIVLLFAFLAFAAYSLFQSGSPQEMAYAEQVQQFAFGTVIAIVVIWFVRRQDRKAGKLRIILENDSTSAKEVPFDWAMAEPATAANRDKDITLAPAFKKNRLLGLFWRVDLVGDNTDARELDKAQPQDRVIWEVPMDDSTTWDHRSRTVTVRAKDFEPHENAESVATYRLIPSDRASKGELEEKEEEIAELESEVEHREKMDAIKDERLEDLEQHLKNTEADSQQEFEQAIQTVLNLLTALNGGNGMNTNGNGENGQEGGFPGLQMPGTSPSTNGEKESSD